MGVRGSGCETPQGYGNQIFNNPDLLRSNPSITSLDVVIFNVAEVGHETLMTARNSPSTYFLRTGKCRAGETAWKQSPSGFNSGGKKRSFGAFPCAGEEVGWDSERAHKIPSAGSFIPDDLVFPQSLDGKSLSMNTLGCSKRPQIIPKSFPGWANRSASPNPPFPQGPWNI